MIGKPYSGKLNVRIDEGELEIGLCHYVSSLLYPFRANPNRGYRSSIYSSIFMSPPWENFSSKIEYEPTASSSKPDLGLLGQGG